MGPTTQRLLAAISLACGLAGCQISRQQPGVLIASDPPGATIHVDGVDSGFVTPAAIYVPRTDWHRVDVSLEGYRAQTRILGPGTQVTVVPWTAGWLGLLTWWFPLWLDARALLVPVRIDDNLQPSRIHVRLRLLEDARHGPAGVRTAPRADGGIEPR
jgi:hypothetical protein